MMERISVIPKLLTRAALLGMLLLVGCRDSEDVTSRYDLSSPEATLRSFVAAMEVKDYRAAAAMIHNWDDAKQKLGANVRKIFEQTGKLGPYPPETLIQYCHARIGCIPKLFQHGTKAEFRTASKVTGLTDKGPHTSDEVELYKGNDGLWRIGDFD